MKWINAFELLAFALDEQHHGRMVRLHCLYVAVGCDPGVLAVGNRTKQKPFYTERKKGRARSDLLDSHVRVLPCSAMVAADSAGTAYLWFACTAIGGRNADACFNKLQGRMNMKYRIALLDSIFREELRDTV